jgi:uncharacterized DUF497 family protein
MKGFEWNAEKNESLRESRGICFEDVVACIVSGGVLDVIDHPNQKKYPGQKMYVVDVNGYAVLVPYVKTDEGMFLKTVIPSRKMTKKYLGR